MTTRAAIALLCCLLAFPVAAKKPVKPPPGPQCSTFGWCAQGAVAGVTGSYTPVVSLGSTIRVYGNFDGTTDGNLYIRSCTWASCGSAVKVIDRNQVTDLPPDAAGVVGIPFIRTTAIVKGSLTGTYYGLLHVGASYPSNIGFRPAWAVSADGVTWQYQHMIAIDGQQRYVYSSSAAMIVQEEKPAILDTVNPANNRFLAWEDAFSIDGVSKRLVLMYSADGSDWRFWRDGNGNVIDVWPAELASDGPVFPTATRTQYGYHIIAADKWPTSAHRHLWSCNGLTWRVIENNADTYSAGKGTNIVAADGLIHALTSGVHWQMTARAFPC